MAQATPKVVAALLALVALAGCSGGDRDAPPRSAGSAGSSQLAPPAGRDTGSPSSPAASEPAEADPSTAREQALADLLRRRAAAVLAHDRAAFAATLDSVTTGFGLRQLAQFDALVRLPLRHFAYGTPEPAPALSAERAAQVGPGAWVSRVSGRYSFAGFDAGDDDFESYFTVVRRGTGWKLADDADGGTQPQPWDLPRMTVLRSPTTLVVGSGPVGRLRAYLALGDVAVRRVRQVWTVPWRAKVVLVVPATTGQMAELVGQSPADVKQVAAVTDGPFDSRGSAVADRVVVNPSAFASLQERGRQVVVTHETTHVAIRATTSRPVPLWLSEGMADFVGYRNVGATRTQIAAALLDRVRAGKGPTALPTEADFDPARATIAPSYNAAWLAVNRIVDQYGRQALVHFYLAVATGSGATGRPTSGATSPGGASPDGTATGSPDVATTDPDAAARSAFGSVLHTTEAAFARAWLGYLKRLASQG